MQHINYNKYFHMYLLLNFRVDLKQIIRILKFFFKSSEACFIAWPLLVTRHPQLYHSCFSYPQDAYANECPLFLRAAITI